MHCVSQSWLAEVQNRKGTEGGLHCGESSQWVGCPTKGFEWGEGERAAKLGSKLAKKRNQQEIESLQWVGFEGFESPGAGWWQSI